MPPPITPSEQKIRGAGASLRSIGVTSAPWLVNESSSTRYMSSVEFEYQSGERGTIALVGSSNLREQNANARLITAAPDLYEALSALLEGRPTEPPRNDPEKTSIAYRNWELFEKGRAALSKATGK